MVRGSEPPRTALDELRAIADVAGRVKALNSYIENGEEKIRDARRLRDEGIRALVETYGPAEAARLAGVSLSTVKSVRRRP